MCGLHSKLKYHVFQEYIINYDFICVSETKCDTLLEGEINTHKMVFMHKTSKSFKYGGIHGLGILIKHCFVDYCTVLNTLISDSILWLHVDKNVLGYDFIIASVYIPHEASIHYNSDVFEDMIDDLITIKATYNVPILLIGDFNGRTGRAPDYVENDDVNLDFSTEDIDMEYLIANHILDRSSQDNHTNNHGLMLIDICKLSGLNIVNGRVGRDKQQGKYTCHTTNGKSVIDYAVVSYELFPYIKDFLVEVQDKSMSDVHCVICLVLCSKELETTGINKIPENDVYTKNKKTVCKWNQDMCIDYKEAFSHENILSIQCKLSSILSSVSNCSQSCIDILYDDLCNVFIEPAKTTGMHKTVNCRSAHKRDRRHKKEEWFNTDCEKYRKVYMDKKNNMCMYDQGDVQNELEYTFKQYKKIIKKTKKQYTKQFHCKIRNMKTRKPKEFWSIINKDCRTQSSNINVDFSDFVHHFEELNNYVPSTPCTLISYTNNDTADCNEDVNCPFTVIEITRIIRRLKCNKACGSDEVLNEFMKNCPISCIHIICDLFNIVLNTGIVPTKWCLGTIIPIYKHKGSQSDPNNYRGITLLSCIGKLFTACINERLALYVETGMLGPEQAGFREGYSTVDHIFVLHIVIDLYLSVKKRVYCAFIDYKKAFDSVERSILWRKLLQYNINGKLLVVIKNMYDNAKSCIRKGNMVSSFFACSIGVRQGENLSPLLFALFINDFSDHISKHYSGLSPLHTCYPTANTEELVFVKIFTLLYADDTVVLSESEAELQLALNAVYDYCCLNKLQVNTDKTKIIIFSRGKVRKFPIFKFGDNSIDVVSDYVYLGVTFNYNNKFPKAIKKQLDQGRKAMFSMLVKSRRLCLPIDIQCDLFDKLVLPVLLYGSEIWGYCKVDMIEVFFRKFIKQILKLNRSTPNGMVYGEVGKLCLQVKIDMYLINFWLRLLDKTESTLAYVFYSLIMNLYSLDIYKTPWLIKIKSILDNCGLSYIWNERAYLDIKLSKKMIHQRIEDLEIQKWYTSISTSPMCEMYNQMKSVFGFENYLLMHDHKGRITLSRFRCRNTKLPIKTTAYLVTSDMCSLCPVGAIGDEYHYVLMCPAFALEREMYIKSYYYTPPTVHKFIQLMCSKNASQMKKLAKFITAVDRCFK